MKNFKDLLSEVAQPKSPEEKAFKDQHKIELIKHPVAPEHIHTGEIPGVTKKERPADPKTGEDEKKYDNGAAAKAKPFKMPRNIDESDSVKAKEPGFAVVDLRLGDGNGLEVVKQIQTSNASSRIIMLTGYGNIPTAVAAIKEGAIDYLAKPADADDVEKALLADPAKKAAPPENPMSADRVKWEHIHRVFELCNRNVSETARRLKMHRRTLQRILSKRSPR